MACTYHCGKIATIEVITRSGVCIVIYKLTCLLLHAVMLLEALTYLKLCRPCNSKSDIRSHQRPSSTLRASKLQGCVFAAECPVGASLFIPMESSSKPDDFSNGMPLACAGVS